MSPRQRLSLLLAALVAVLALAVVLTGGTSTTHSAAPSRSATLAAFAASPPALAALHVQADRLLGGGPRAFRARLRELHGHPVVVNEWASWCVPCQAEFPAYQRASVSFGRRVAFLGVDGKDSAASAAAFLRRFPVSYPSYSDPDQAIGQALQTAILYPQTIYFDAGGREVYDHGGPYRNAAALERDIRRYLLQ